MKNSKTTALTIEEATKMAKDLQERICHENQWTGSKKSYHFNNEFEAYDLAKFVLQYFTNNSL